ncbi:TT1751-like protein [Cadophora sp. DSE1049]|nr:TT1751-like protein [Cadophora sp. DSE1049]
MSYSPVSQSQQFEASRITLTSSKPYDDVLNTLYTSIGSPDAVSEWPKMMREISQSADPREQFTNTVNKTIGPHGFMIFQEFNHGAWIPLFGVGDGLKSKRIILGNPLIAITMLKHDINAGLFVPVEILVLEKKEGTEIIYNLPSGLIAGLNKDPELCSASEKLDEKLAVLLKDVLS